MIFYISDMHFCHENIMAYDDRPWNSVQSMNEGLIANYNSVVTEDDVVYNLGDFVWEDYKYWKEIIGKLNGQMFFIKGNHDPETFLDYAVRDFPGKVLGWSEQKTIKDGLRTVVLNHCPISSFPYMLSCFGYHVYGHVHGTYDHNITEHTRKIYESYYERRIKMYNAGVMHTGYKPVTLDELIGIYSAKHEN